MKFPIKIKKKKNTPGSDEASIEDDYVAPDIQDIEAAKEGDEATSDEDKANAAKDDAPTITEKQESFEKIASVAVDESAKPADTAAVEEGGDANADAAVAQEAPSPAKTSWFGWGSSATPAAAAAATEDKLLDDEEQAAAVQTKSSNLSKKDEEALEDGGYVNADTEGEEENDGAAPPPMEEIALFDGVKGTIQPPKYKDVKYLLLFWLHYGIVGYLTYQSFIKKYNGYNGGYYSQFDHVGLTTFVVITGLAGLGISFFTFGYMLRHGETILKTVIVLSNAMCLGVGLCGLFVGETFIFVSGIIGFAIVSVYASAVWKRIPFTAANLSVAISAVRDNMGLFVGALVVAAIGFIPLIIIAMAGVEARKAYGGWALAYTIFSFYWTNQVLSNIMSVATAGIIGRWLVIGETTPDFSAGLKETLVRARSYSFGSVCFGSLFFGSISMIQGLSSFLSSKRVPLLPRILNGILSVMKKLSRENNEFAYVYIGLYGYSFPSAGKNVKTLLQNKGWYGIVQHRMAGNILFVANLAIGLMTGFCGLLTAAYEYRNLRQSGLNNPTSDGFLVGLLAGFMMSSIILSVITAAMNTIIVGMAESPAEFKANHPNLSKRMIKSWKKAEENVADEEGYAVM